MIYNADELVKRAIKDWPCACVDGGRWVLARPISGTFRFERLKAAWEVFRGRADALKWTSQ
jgi:hypothetical protein